MKNKPTYKELELSIKKLRRSWKWTYWTAVLLGLVFLFLLGATGIVNQKLESENQLLFEKLEDRYWCYMDENILHINSMDMFYQGWRDTDYYGEEELNEKLYFFGLNLEECQKLTIEEAERFSSHLKSHEVFE